MPQWVLNINMLSATYSIAGEHSYWRHDLETLFALLTLCDGFHWSHVVPHKRPVTQNFDDVFNARLRLNNNGFACDLAHRVAHVKSL